jgi:hypothetical protein
MIASHLVPTLRVPLRGRLDYVLQMNGLNGCTSTMNKRHDHTFSTYREDEKNLLFCFEATYTCYKSKAFIQSTLL